MSDKFRDESVPLSALAQTIADTIEALPAATRLYPDVYAELVANAARSRYLELLAEHRDTNAAANALLDPGVPGFGYQTRSR